MGQPVTEITLEVRLTERELEVLNLMGKGISKTEIARILKISRSTAGVHAAMIYAKLSASNQCEAVANAFRAGILE